MLRQAQHDKVRETFEIAAKLFVGKQYGLLKKFNSIINARNERLAVFSCQPSDYEVLKNYIIPAHKYPGGRGASPRTSKAA
jgi:hypothetical protein